MDEEIGDYRYLNRNIQFLQSTLENEMCIFLVSRVVKIIQQIPKNKSSDSDYNSITASLGEVHKVD